MVLNPQDYEPDKEDGGYRARLAACDLLRNETQSDHERALEIVEKIMQKYDLTPEKIKHELDVGGVDWAKAGDKIIDLSFLYNAD